MVKLTIKKKKTTASYAFKIKLSENNTKHMVNAVERSTFFTFRQQNSLVIWRKISWFWL